MSGPPFRAIDHALYFAFSVLAQDVVDISSIYKRRERDARKAPDLSVWERHGQAGQIIGLVEKHLDYDQQVYVGARFGRVPQCIDAMQQQMLGWLGSGVHPRHGVRAVWSMHCGALGGVKRLARAMGGKRTADVVQFRRQLSRPLQDRYRQIHERLEEPMVSRGIVSFVHGEVECS